MIILKTTLDEIGNCFQFHASVFRMLKSAVLWLLVSMWMWMWISCSCDSFWNQKKEMEDFEKFKKDGLINNY
jgi:hypothetical protein